MKKLKSKEITDTTNLRLAPRGLIAAILIKHGLIKRPQFDDAVEEIYQQLLPIFKDVWGAGISMAKAARPSFFKQLELIFKGTRYGKYITDVIMRDFGNKHYALQVLADLDILSREPGVKNGNGST